jgi:hypothetical protein
MPSADAMGVTPIEKAEASRRAALAGSNRAGFDDIAKDLLNDLNAGKADAGSLRREAAQEAANANAAAREKAELEAQLLENEKTVYNVSRRNQQLEQLLNLETEAHGTVKAEHRAASAKLTQLSQEVGWLRDNPSAWGGCAWDLHLSRARSSGGLWLGDGAVGAAPAPAVRWLPAEEPEVGVQPDPLRLVLVAALPFPRGGAPNTCRLRLRRGARVRFGVSSQGDAWRMASSVLSTAMPPVTAEGAAQYLELDVTLDLGLSTMSYETVEHAPVAWSISAREEGTPSHLLVELLPEPDDETHQVSEEFRSLEWVKSFGGGGCLRAAAAADRQLRSELENAICERLGMEEELGKCRAQLKALAVDKARLQRNAASAKAEAEAVAEAEQVLLHRALESSREEQQMLELAVKGLTTDKTALTEEVATLRAEAMMLRSNIAAKEKELAERPDLGMVVSAVQNAQQQTCTTVRAESDRLSAALPRVRAVQLVATQREQAHADHAAAAERSEAENPDANVVEAETSAAVAAAVAAKAAGMGDEQAVAAAARAAAAAAEALARGAVVFPVRSTVGLAAVDSKLQATLRRNMGEELFQNYVGALTSVEGPAGASSLTPSPPPRSGGAAGSRGRSDWWRSMPGEMEPWSGDKAVDAARQAGVKATASPRQRPGQGLGSLGDWLDVYGTPREVAQVVPMTS